MKYTGKTNDASVPILGAAWWKKGASISGVVTRRFTTKNGPCTELHLAKPVTFDGKQESKVAIGNLAGFNMALAAAGLESLLPKDTVKLTCLGVSETEHESDRVDFEIEVDRPSGKN